MNKEELELIQALIIETINLYQAETEEMRQEFKESIIKIEKELLKTKEKLNFKESCEFYCNYHKVSKTETAMICGNLGIVVDRLLKEQEKEIIRKNHPSY